MKELTQERLKELLHYDPLTGDFTWKVRKNGTKGIGSKAGCINKGHGYLVIGVNGVGYLAHRLAWLYVHGVWPKDQIDHINHNCSDNRLENLREADGSINQRNKSIQSNNTSGFTGVQQWGYYADGRERWVAFDPLAGKEVYRGDDYHLACQARLKAEEKHGFHRNHGC